MNNNVLSSLQDAGVLSALGLQSRASSSSRVLTYAAFAAVGMAAGAATVLVLVSRYGRQLRGDLGVGAHDLNGQMHVAAASAMEAAKRKVGHMKDGVELATKA